MKYSEFEEVHDKKVDFSKDNKISTLLMLLCFAVIIMGGLLYKQDRVHYSYQQLHQRVAVQAESIEKYKRQAEKRKKLIMKYEAERSQIVDISFYTRSVRETDDTPNQSAILTFARPGFTVAVSHDLKWMLGHYIYIYGRGVFYVEDLMNERYTKRLDILVDSVKDIPNVGVLTGQEVIVLGKDIELYYE